ncbi:MAG: type IV pili methyl-accepting chemotaxis transducer N-terminal domain-containing protein [Bacteroidia bacterium]
MTKFNHKYLVATAILVALIFVNQSIIQYLLYKKKHNAEVINLGGRQRMLSQRLKSQLFKEYMEMPTAAQSAKDVFSELESSHIRLQELTVNYSSNLKDELKRVGERVGAIKSDVFSENKIGIDRLKAIDLALDEFLVEMDALVNEFEQYANLRLKAIIFTELIIAFVTIIVIVSQVVFVFIPLGRKLLYRNMALQANFNELEKSKSTQENLVNILSQKVQQNNEVNKIISHNVRPSIINLEQLLLMYRAEADQTIKSKIIDRIFSVSGSLGTMAEKIKDRFLVLQDDEIKPVDLDIEEVVNDVLNYHHDEIVSLHAKVDVQLGQTHVNFYRPYFRSALVNIVGNALKFSSPKRPIHVLISSYLKNDKIVVSVRDNGLGINLQEYGHKIFGLGQRFHPFIKGTGFDLFLTKSQLKSLEASISVDSVVDDFTEFKMAFKK